MKDYLIYAVDFDGTICKDNFPEIGEPNLVLLSWMKQMQEQGNKLILWTCRNGLYLEQAVEFVKAHGITFDAVNAHLPEQIEEWGTDPRKIGADFYIDDKALSVWGFDEEEDEPTYTNQDLGHDYEYDLMHDLDDVEDIEEEEEE